MTLFGIDVHPDFQRGLDIGQVAAEGFGFLSVKVSQGTNNQWELDTPARPGARTWIAQGKKAGLVCLAYHYLTGATDIGAQAQVFAGALKRCQVPGVIDAEDVVKQGDLLVPSLTITMIRQFVAALRALGANVPFLYLPNWYWQRMGKPDLSGLPTLWASSYPTSRQAVASELFELVGPDRWQAYGGNAVGVLQFAETAQVAGHTVDANAFPGDQQSFARFVGSTTRRRQPMCYILPPTPVPAGAGPDDPPAGGWPTTEYTLTSPGPAGGWPGRELWHATFGYRGAFVEEAWSAPSGKHYVNRYDPTKNTGGAYIKQFDTQHWEMTPGDCSLIIRYATRVPGSAATEPQN